MNWLNTPAKRGYFSLFVIDILILLISLPFGGFKNWVFINFVVLPCTILGVMLLFIAVGYVTTWIDENRLIKFSELWERILFIFGVR